MEIKPFAFFALVFGLLLLGCLYYQQPATNIPPASEQVSVPSATAVPAANVVEVKIQGYKFIPAEISISPGTTVKWTNLDSAPHNAISTSAPAGGEFGTRTLGNGESASVVFNTPGDFAYYCSIHPKMTGKITVS
ncbi:MAG: plastocyanin/azurin family copper-binding protein [Candidatus Micrarchaeia archaeon]|jgi:plastocyanin